MSFFSEPFHWMIKHLVPFCGNIQLVRVMKTLSPRRHWRPQSFLKSESVLKLSRLSGKFRESPESFFYSLESFQIVWKVSGQCEKFPDMYGIHGMYTYAKAIYALLHIYVANPFYALLAYFFATKMINAVF